MRKILGVVQACLVAAALAGPGSALAADPAVKLFKVVTPKDEMLIGVTETELRGYGPLPDVENLAQRLGSAGQIAAWQYAVRKGSDGQLQQAPLQRVAVFAAGVVRIEPYRSPRRVVPPGR